MVCTHCGLEVTLKAGHRPTVVVQKAVGFEAVNTVDRDEVRSGDHWVCPACEERQPV